MFSDEFEGELDEFVLALGLIEESLFIGFDVDLYLSAVEESDNAGAFFACHV